VCTTCDAAEEERRDSMLDFSLRFLSAAEVDLLLAKEQHTKER
jgi:hypothetical protein